MDKNILEQAKNRDEVFKKFLQMEHNQGANSNHLAFLDRGIENSPYQTEVAHYPLYLKQKPLRFSPYPKRGKIPDIDPDGLDFLHEEIQEACVCLARLEAGKLQTIWVGKNPLRNNQFWSSTKIIPVLNTLSQIQKKFPGSSVENWRIIDPEDESVKIAFQDAVEDIVSYDKRTASSNALAAMFKRFETPEKLERWWQKITGNYHLEFQGYYGETPWILNPELLDVEKQEILLKAVPESLRGENLVSAYDLTRIISMVGWHHHLEPKKQIPGVNLESLKPVIIALGKDTARFVDVAFEMLGLETIIRFPVVLSKLGHGPSSLRNTIETTYTALVQFVDPLPKDEGKPAKLRMIAMTLRGAIPLENIDDFNQESLRLDARIAAEVTEIIRRSVTEELDELV